jgi:hypothetical protein
MGPPATTDPGSDPMILRRIVPNLNVDDATTGHDFYEEFLGLRKQFDMGGSPASDHRRTRVCR